MSSTSILCIITLSAAGAAYAADATSAAPPPTSDEVSELRALVTDLRQQVEQLKTQSNDHWLTEQRAGEIRNLIQDVLADADTRTSLADGGITAGYDKGFILASTDGNFRLKIGGQLQVRYVYNHQDDSPVDDNRSGFEMRRTRLLLSGHIVDPSWTYDVQFAADRSNGNVQLEDAGWIQKDLGEGWKLKFGQMKAPFLREEMLSSIRMLAVERSLLNAQFTAGTVQGVQASWESSTIRAYAMYHDGNRTPNTAWSAEDTEYAFTARAEWLASGEWKNFLDYNSFKDEGAGFLLGAAVNYSVQEFGTTTNDAEVENFGFTVDATADFGGGSVAGAFVYRNLQTDTGAPGDLDNDQFGFLVRGGLFITDDWELYAQYEWGDVDTTGIEDLSVITIGASKYWAKHSLKWQTDFGYALDEIAATWAQEGAGWRTDTAGEDGQIVIRSQFQLVF